MTIYIMTFILFLVGLYGVLTKRNMIKIVIGFSIMEFSIFLFLSLIGYVENGIAPIVQKADESVTYVDPLPQAMVLTAIVIGLATTSMLLAIAIRIYKKYGTFDIHKVNELKG